MIQSGDRLDVVLDVYADEDEYRVVMVGAFEPDQHRSIPPLEPGASRNVVQTFLGMRHSFGAFRMGRSTDRDVDLDDEIDEDIDDDDAEADADSDIFALIAEIASRLTDATDEGEYHAAGLIGDLANGRTTVAEARSELAEITFRHV